MAKTVTINAAERRTLWLAATFAGERPAEALRSLFAGMHPCPANDQRSEVPDRQDVTRKTEELAEHVAFFDALDWHLHTRTLEFQLTEAMVPYLLRLLKSQRDQMGGDYSGILVRYIEDGRLADIDWLPEGNRSRQVEDELLEVSSVLWSIVDQFGVKAPLTLALQEGRG